MVSHKETIWSASQVELYSFNIWSEMAQLGDSHKTTIIQSTSKMDRTHNSSTVIFPVYLLYYFTVFICQRVLQSPRRFCRPNLVSFRAALPCGVGGTVPTIYGHVFMYVNCDWFIFWAAHYNKLNFKVMNRH